MSVNKIKSALLSVLLISATNSFADTAYVTDSITVGIFKSSDLKGEPLERLPSGALLDILQSSADVAKVKSGSGKIGWMRTTFLTTNLPANIQLENTVHELSKANVAIDRRDKEIKKLKDVAKQAKKDTGWMKAEMEKARKKAAELSKQLKAEQSQVSEVDSQTDSLASQVDELTAKNTDLEQRLAATLLLNDIVEPNDIAEEKDLSLNKVSSLWGVAGLVLGLVAGFAAGFYWLDRRVRQRFGGVRVY